MGVIDGGKSKGIEDDSGVARSVTFFVSSTVSIYDMRAANAHGRRVICKNSNYLEKCLVGTGSA